MKKFNYFILLVGGLLTFSTVIAQKDSSGFYSTANDFKVVKLSYAINYKTEKHKINDYIFLNSEQVKVKHYGRDSIHKGMDHGPRGMDTIHRRRHN